MVPPDAWIALAATVVVLTGLALLVRAIRGRAVAETERDQAQLDRKRTEASEDVASNPGPARDRLGEYWKRLRRG